MCPASLIRADWKIESFTVITHYRLSGRSLISPGEGSAPFPTTSALLAVLWRIRICKYFSLSEIASVPTAALGSQHDLLRV